MDEIFKNMIEEHFHQEMYEAVQDEIVENYADYDLTRRADVVQEVLEASVDTLDVLRVYNIQQDDEDVSFTVLVSCCIEIGDYAYGEDITEDITQWFELSCSALLNNAEITDFSVDEIKACNKK